VVQIQDSNSEAWGNLAACFTKTNRKKEAFSCIQQAVKHNETSWKLWSNYMVFSLELHKFSSFLESVRKLIELDQKFVLDREVLEKTRQVFTLFLDKFMAGQCDKRNVEFYKENVESTLKFACDKIGEKWEVWDQMAEFYLNLSDFKAFVSKKNISNQEQPLTDVKSKVKFFEEPEKPKKNEKKDDFKEKAYEARLKSCQCLMIIGWELQKELCEKLKAQLIRLVSDFKEMPIEAQDSEKLKFLLEAVNGKLMKSLEIPASELIWL